MLPGMQRPYFIEYRLDDITQLRGRRQLRRAHPEEANHQRIVRVTVRIGDYAMDSSSSRGDGTVELAPTDDNPLALRYALWTATDEAYKNALRAYSAKQAALKQFQSAQAQQDFAQVKPVVQIVSAASALDLDRNEWKRRIVEASGLFASDPEVRPFAEHVQYSTANIRAIALNRYLVNTEGTMLRHGYTGYNGAISVGGQAADGMRLSRDNGTVATTAKELESASAFRKRVIDDLKSFEELRNAPVVSAEDYHGPVLFTGDAAADVFNRLFVPNVEADRPEMGTTARTTGAYSSSYKSRVLPDIHQRHRRSAPDEVQRQGAARRLHRRRRRRSGAVGRHRRSTASSRTSSSAASPSRTSPPPTATDAPPRHRPAHSRSGVLLIKADQPLSKDELNKRLLAMAKEQKQGRLRRRNPGRRTPPAPALPRPCRRHPPARSRSRLRRARQPQPALRIVAAGNDPYVSNSLGAFPQTIIAPSLLFDDIGVKRATEEQQKLPYYPSTPANNTKDQGENEMQLDPRRSSCSPSAVLFAPALRRPVVKGSAVRDPRRPRLPFEATVRLGTRHRASALLRALRLA